VGEAYSYKNGSEEIIIDDSVDINDLADGTEIITRAGTNYY